MSVSDHLATAWNLFKSKIGLLLGLTLMQFVVVMAGALAATLVIGLGIFATMADVINNDGVPTGGQIFGAIVIGIIGMVAMMALSVWAAVKYTSMQAVVIDQQARGMDPSWSSANEHTRGVGRRALPLILLGIGAGIVLYLFMAVVVGFGVYAAQGDPSPAFVILMLLLGLALWLGLIYLSVRWAYIYQLLGVERLAGTDVLGRSWQLTKGRFWPTLGRMFVGGLVFGVVLFLVEALFGWASNNDMNALVMLLSLVSMVVGLLQGAWTVAFTTTMYIDQVRRHAAAGIPNTYVGKSAPLPGAGFAPGVGAQMGAQPVVTAPQQPAEVDTWGQTPTGPLGTPAQPERTQPVSEPTSQAFGHTVQETSSTPVTGPGSQGGSSVAGPGTPATTDATAPHVSEPTRFVQDEQRTDVVGGQEPTRFLETNEPTGQVPGTEPTRPIDGTGSSGQDPQNPWARPDDKQ